MSKMLDKLFRSAEGKFSWKVAGLFGAIAAQSSFVAGNISKSANVKKGSRLQNEAAQQWTKHKSLHFSKL